MRRTLLSLIIAVIVLAPATASAVDWFPIVPCGGSQQVACTPCDLFKTFKNVIDMVLIGITGPIAAFMIVWAGGMMLLGGAKPELFIQGKKILWNTLWGVSIILLAWLFTNTLIKSLATGSQFDAWYEFSCPEGLSRIPPIDTVLPTGGAPVALPAAIEIAPIYGGAPTLGSTTDSCGKDIRCAKPGPVKCPRLEQYTAKYANANLLQAIMLNESSCRINPPPSGAGAYGLMQIQPATAKKFVEACDLYTTGTDGVRTPDPIDAGFLQSEINTAKIVCIASKLLDSLVRSCGTNPLHLAAGYNGSRACEPSVSCAQTPSCSGGNMRRWECPWNNVAHTSVNTGYEETRKYAPKVAACTV